MAVINAVRMALCIECSPAVQEVPGSIPVASVLPMLYAEDVGGPGQAPTSAALNLCIFMIVPRLQCCIYTNVKTGFR
jgi:hypothetical protein